MWLVLCAEAPVEVLCGSYPHFRSIGVLNAVSITRTPSLFSRNLQGAMMINLFYMHSTTRNYFFP